MLKIVEWTEPGKQPGELLGSMPLVLEPVPLRVKEPLQTAKRSDRAEPRTNKSLVAGLGADEEEATAHILRDGHTTLGDPQGGVLVRARFAIFDLGFVLAVAPFKLTAGIDEPWGRVERR